MLHYHYHLEMERQRRRELRHGNRRRSQAVHPSRRGVARVVGRLMVDVGSRLAADPLSGRARSR